MPRLLRSLLLFPALLCRPTLGAQAPIERRLPSAPQSALSQIPDPAEEREWQRLERRAQQGSSEEVRVQALGSPLRCSLDDVTATDLYCTEFRPFSSPVSRAFFPPVAYRVPRPEIRDVREGGRGWSTLAGLLAGAGLGAGLGARNQADPQGVALVNAALFGAVGAGIGHLAPFKGHLVYHRR